MDLAGNDVHAHELEEQIREGLNTPTMAVIARNHNKGDSDKPGPPDNRVQQEPVR